MSGAAGAITGVLGASALLTLSGLSVGEALRTVVGIALVGVGPGWAALRHIALDPLERVVLAVAASLVMATSVAALLMYAGWWSPARAVIIIVTLTVGATGWQRRRVVAPDRQQ